MRGPAGLGRELGLLLNAIHPVPTNSSGQSGASTVRVDGQLNGETEPPIARPLPTPDQIEVIDVEEDLVEEINGQETGEDEEGVRGAELVGRAQQLLEKALDIQAKVADTQLRTAKALEKMADVLLQNGRGGGGIHKGYGE